MDRREETKTNEHKTHSRREESVVIDDTDADDELGSNKSYLNILGQEK